MPTDLSRRGLLRLGALSTMALAGTESLISQATPAAPASGAVYLNLNENAFGPSPRVQPAIQQALSQLNRYATADLAAQFTQQVAAYENVSPDQVILGEILGGLGLHLSSTGGPGGEFLYSTPGYLALIDAAAQLGGVGVPVPLNAAGANDLPALQERIGPKTRAVYLINPHNPTGVLNEASAFQSFLRNASQRAPVIVDEAYLEYSTDFRTRSAVTLVREGANVLVFRTFDKIHGLAGLPIGYTLGPKALIATLKQQGLEDAEGLGRLNLAAASAALADPDHIPRVRSTVAAERETWNGVLRDLRLKHTPSAANFVFFDAGRPHDEVAGSMRQQGVVVARAFPPYSTWVRITIGTPQQNAAAQQALRRALA
ncbi:pyridoxal phosphate-dependent aminotransferase [Terriglobus aquaticus]|uniref:Pyridoxal phosphate-dependent aminotransferase n=1 Tax=Terriglobus aquaticus TaxID=940139 RepID=A0ABW9KHG7_9BACT|nr:aminotransferase class I/II-fold pyridoxal phosphate-dependent enzyme [Terriglobus aquaticus]